MKKFLLATLCLSAAVLSAAIPYTRTAEPAPDLTPKRKRLAPEVLMYPENQYKYGLFQNFLEGYIDRPLFFDRATRYTEKFAYSTQESFTRDAEIMRTYGFNGGGNLQYKGHLSAEKFAMAEQARLGGWYKQFPQFAFGESGVFFVKPDEKIKWLKASLANKALMPVINGKVPISVYNAANISPEAMRGFIARLRQECGDTFYLVCNLQISHDTVGEFKRTGKLSAGTIEKYRKNIDRILTDFGGIQLRPVHDYDSNDYTYTPSCEIYDRYIEPLLLEALAKPQFQDKIVVGMVQQGYINHMSGVNRGEYGTKRIRQFMDRYARINCDMVFFFEWNEFNENTCWQPTLNNHLVNQRLTRYYANVMRGKAPEPNPGDDLNIPPMSLSTRETVKLGETLYFELLNIPDTLKSAAYTAKLELLDLKGNVMLSFPEEKFDRARLDAVSYRVPSENFAGHAALKLRLTVSDANGKPLVTEGFQSIRILPTFCYNYKSIRHSLRDMLRPEKIEFTAKAIGNNQYRVRGSVSSPELLNSLEVLDFGKEVFAVDKTNEFDRTKYEIIVGDINAIFSSRRPVEITVTGTDDWDFREWGFPNVTLNMPKRKGNKIASTWPVWAAESRFILKISKADAAKTQITFTVDGESKTFAVADIMKLGQLAHAYPLCRLTWTNYHHLPDIAPRINEKTASFDTIITSDRSYPVLQMRAVTNNGKIYRTAPVIPRPIPAATEKLNVFSSYTGKVVTVDAISALIPKLAWQVDPQAGDLLLNGFDRYFRCDLGGGYTYRGVYHTKSMVPKNSRHNPKFVQEDGKNVLDFDGSTYLHFPLETLPRGSFALRFSIKPEPDDKTTQYVLFRHYDRILGSVTVFTKFDRICFAFGDKQLKTHRISTTLELPQGKWSDVIVSYNLKEVTISVNGVKKSFPLEAARALYFKPAVFGGHTKAEFGLPTKTVMFKGKLRAISIDHNAAF